MKNGNRSFSELGHSLVSEKKEHRPLKDDELGPPPKTPGIMTTQQIGNDSEEKLEDDKKNDTK